MLLYRLLDFLPDTPRNRAMIAKIRPAVERCAGGEWRSRRGR